MSKPERKQFNGKREPKEFEEEVIQIDRVTRVVKGGRRLRFRATVVVGDKKDESDTELVNQLKFQMQFQKLCQKLERT